MSLTTSFAPSSANRLAIASPKPEPPPVTMATLPCNRMPCPPGLWDGSVAWRRGHEKSGNDVDDRAAAAERRRPAGRRGRRFGLDRRRYSDRRSGLHGFDRAQGTNLRQHGLLGRRECAGNGRASHAASLPKYGKRRVNRVLVAGARRFYSTDK